MGIKIVAIIGSYRKGGTIDQAAAEVLRSAEQAGATTSTIRLMDKRIEFCTNCRSCTQSPGVQRGVCVLQDDMQSILAEIESADAVVFAAPVNFFNLNAVSRRFMERLLCCTYWPWGQLAPTFRIKQRRKKAVLITSSAMPGFAVGLMTGAVSALKLMAKAVGAKPVGVLVVGLAAGKAKMELRPSVMKKAQALGRKLAK